ncbi:MAG: hypothetical protein QM767_14505 [Anaeromyxobacter sp.]
MLEYKNDLLEHLRWLREAVLGASAELIVAGHSVQALIRREPAVLALEPLFKGNVDGQTLFTPQLHPQADRFMGWLPYPPRRWDAAADRLAFKAHAQKVGLRVPGTFTEAKGAPADVVVKRPQPSADHPPRGPYRSAFEQPLSEADGEYYEPLVIGDRLKVWFWCGQAVCAELDRLPSVLGDGASSLRDLVIHRASFTGPRTDREAQLLLARVETVLQFFRTTPSAVLPAGQRQIVDLHHGSELAHPSDRQHIDFLSAPDEGWFAEIRKAGPLLLEALPEAQRGDALFTADIVLDEEGRPWFLGMNSVFAVHPLVYRAMIPALLERRGASLPEPLPEQAPATTADAS